MQRTSVSPSLSSARHQISDTSIKEVFTASSNVRVVYHSNAIKMKTTESATRVEELVIRSLSGKAGSIQARYYVVCCGAIETARLLLNSTSVEKSGLGNRHDLVGRFLHDHLHMQSAPVVPRNRRRFARTFQQIYDGNVHYCPKIASTFQFQKRNEILNIAGDIYYESAEDSPIQTAKRIEPYRERRRANDVSEATVACSS